MPRHRSKRERRAKGGGKRVESSQKKEAEDKFNVFVQFPDGEIGEIETFGSQTIRDLKGAIEISYGSANLTAKMTLFKGMDLEDDKCLHDYSINENSTVVVQMQIYVDFQSRKGFLLDVDPSVTVIEVKAMIESKEQDVPMLHQRLFSDKGNNLDNDMTLSECGISDLDNLFVLTTVNDEPPQEGYTQIYIKDDEKIHTLNVAPYITTVADVKRMLWEKEGVHPDFQRLSFGGRYLENPSGMLWENGISSECLLDLVTSQESERGNVQVQHEHVVDSMEHELTQDDEKMRILLWNPALQNDGIPYQVKKDDPLGAIFSDYAGRVGIPTSDLEFHYGDYDALPPDCQFSADELALSDGDTILVNSTVSHFPDMLNGSSELGERNSTLDLTGFSTGSNSTEDSIFVSLQGVGEKTRIKIDRNSTSLQLIFNYFADCKNVDPDSLTYVCGARRFSHEADETAAQVGIINEDIIHAIEKKEPSISTLNRTGKIALNLQEIGRPDSENEYFRVDVNVRLERIFKSFAARKEFELSQLRFLYRGRILYADSDDDTTPAQLGIQEGETVTVLIKKPELSMSITPNGVKTLYQMPRDRIFEPVVQVIELDKANRELTVSDGNNFFSLHFHARLSRLIESGTISKFSIIWASDISIETFGCNQQKGFSLLDADMAASNPGRIIGSPTEMAIIDKGDVISAKERHSMECIAKFVQHRYRLRKVRKIVARNVIVCFIWRCHEQGQQRKARNTIGDLVWQRVAMRRRQQLRRSATMIQKLQRGQSTRKIYGEPVQIRLEEFRRFSSVWKSTVEQVPTSVQTLTGWALVREKIDVKKMEFMDEDGNLADTDEKLSKALTGALNEDVSEEEDSDFDGEEIESKFEDVTVEENKVSKEEQLSNLDWSQFQVTAHVVKFMKNGDAKYREIFVKKMKQLAKGERSHKLQKPLKGCDSIIYETYLENKSGFRILWTQEGDRIVVWFIAKHKSVSRLMKLIDDAKNRTARQQLSDSFVSALENGSDICPASPSKGKKGILLDALGNVPLKLYDVHFDNVDDIVKKSWTPQMHLTEEERQVVEAKGTVLLLGRSGTGKTVCICNRIEYDRQRLGHKPNFSQLFVSRSSGLCSYVKNSVGNIEGISFTTFEKLVGHLIESPLSQTINRSFHQRHHVNFARFRQEFYIARHPQEDVSALIVWKAIRTFIKGSIEAFQASTGFLSRDYFVHPKKLGKNRCKVPLEMRDFVFDIFLQYRLWMDEGQLWDDCDRIRAILKGMEDAKRSDPTTYNDQIKRNKLYVDEVQDYIQLEILLFFYMGGGPGALFLAGDPAQSVVEGTDFRFEEVRSVGYFVAGKERSHLIPEKPKTVNVNFRSHAGVLNCAGGFLDLLFRYFPGSAKQLAKDFGLFKGARPGVFQNVGALQLSSLLREKMPGAIVLTHDESAHHWKNLLGHKLVYGIREAKGMEFKRVIVLDFFAELPSSLQKPWRNLLLDREGSDFESKFPLVEAHLKLAYTAVTRCIEQLFFAETKPSVAGDAAVRWLTTIMNNKQHASNEALATINNVTDLESMAMTNDEFCVVGVDNAELAGSSDIEFQPALTYLDRAIHCFQQAQSADLVAKAQVHIESVQLRKRIIQIDSSIVTMDVRGEMEKQAAKTMGLLLKENLLIECMKLLGSVTPLLTPYTQQKLDDCVASRIRHFASEL